MRTYKKINNYQKNDGYKIQTNQMWKNKNKIKVICVNWPSMSEIKSRLWDNDKKYIFFYKKYKQNKINMNPKEI